MSETQNARSAAVTLGGLFAVVDPVGASGNAGLHADATNARAIAAKVPLAEVAGLTDRSRAGRGSPPQQVFPRDLMVPADLSRFANESGFSNACATAAQRRHTDSTQQIARRAFIGVVTVGIDAGIGAYWLAWLRLKARTKV